MQTYADIKAALAILYGPYVGNNFISTDTGSPTDIAILLRLANNRILSKPIEWPFQQETTTIALVGGQMTYDLRTNIPDVKSVYQLFGVNQNQEHPYRPNYEANIIPATGYTIRNKILVFTGNTPSSGNFSVQYKSKWMVKNAAGARKQDFENEDDYSVLDDDNVNLLLWMVGEFVQWKADVASSERKKEVKDWLAEAYGDLRDYNENTSQIHYML